MKASSMYGSFLATEDIHEETTVTIESIEVGEFSGENGKVKKLIFSFTDLPARLAVNTENAKVLIDKFGDETDGWLGKKIVLFVDPTVKFRNKTVGGIRIKA